MRTVKAFSQSVKVLRGKIVKPTLMRIEPGKNQRDHAFEVVAGKEGLGRLEHLAGKGGDLDFENAGNAPRI